MGRASAGVMTDLVPHRTGLQAMGGRHNSEIVASRRWLGRQAGEEMVGREGPRVAEWFGRVGLRGRGGSTTRPQVVG